MKGFVPTPAHVVDLMVARLFRGRAPTRTAALLDPGCGEGEFIAGVLRWCAAHEQPIPTIVGVELEPARAAYATRRFAQVQEVSIRQSDFLEPSQDRFDFIIGNPPYVPITALSIAERDRYRRTYTTASGRFDLYLLFFEQALRVLRDDGRLVFITPEKFLYVGTARPLRKLLASRHVEELYFLAEDTFANLVTYPLVSTISGASGRRETRVISRDGRRRTVRLDSESSWQPAVHGHRRRTHEYRLADACIRISCGVATGADSVFVQRAADLSPSLGRFAYPTIAGRQLQPGETLATPFSMLLPYSRDGSLMPEHSLGPLKAYLESDARRAQLERRTCAARKRWYAFHENPPLRDILRPKLLCKDVTATPFFTVDRSGHIVPRHSVYYIVPADPRMIDALATYLNSSLARRWLHANCQRAANGFLRLQSHVLKRLPIPTELAPAQRVEEQLALAIGGTSA
ncbi:MAG: HsdM family class I SAM-dependent methyltransferase [Gemmatimonadaceae bacterium]